MKTIKRVWVGFVSGRPATYHCDLDGYTIAVFPTKQAGLDKYEDVRRATLVIDEPKGKSKSLVVTGGEG